MSEEAEIQEILETLSPIEQKIVPFLNESIENIIIKSELDKTSVLRALQFLENKNLLEIKSETKTFVDLDTNGIYYKKKGLPERNLIILLEEKNHLPLEEAKKLSKLSDNEFRVSLGVLKRKALIDLKNGTLLLNASKEELTKKTLEEQLIDTLPLAIDNLEPEQKLALENLKKRKEIIEIKDKKTTSFSLKNLGKEIAGQEINLNLIEEVTPEIIKSFSSSKSKKFRKYDLHSQVPSINGGKRHFVNQAVKYGRKVWTDLGFKEMSGTLIQSSFWNFDALFTAQDHPVRELQDTFYLKDIKAKLPDKTLVNAVKKTHEQGIDKSKGWQYVWDLEDAKKSVLRTHTTCLSVQTLSKLKKKDLPAKFFAIGKNFRNETVDWSHGFEFYQSEGIVVDKNANFRHLLGYLKEFYKKMGFEKIRFTPAYFPYTEPSVEINVYHPERKVWLELGGAGIFRPEVVVPLLGEYVPVLAWGP